MPVDRSDRFPVGLAVVPPSESREPVGAADPLVEHAAACWAEAVIDGSRDVVLVLARDATIKISNSAANRVLGLRPESIIESPVIDLIHPDDAEALLMWMHRVIQSATSSSIELRCLHANGGWIDIEASATVMLDVPGVDGIVLTLRDISERKSLESELTHWTSHDSLTGLANGLRLRERVIGALDRAARRDSRLAVLLVGLDGFRQVNESLGRGAGDRVLIAVADRLSQCLPDSGLVARLSGDEFAVLLDDITDDDAASGLADAVLAALAEPVLLGTTSVRPSASIGIRLVDSETSSDDCDQLLRDADLAMCAAKADRAGSWQFFQPEMHVIAQRQLTIQSELHRAVAEEQFVLHYQPVVSLASGEIVGFEALVRWQHPVRGLVAPDQFISIAEQTGLIIPLGAWVLRSACLAATKLRRLSGLDLVMSVNVAPRQLLSDDILDVVESALQEADLPADALCLEITESALAVESGLIERLKHLRSLGSHLAIDDFGTGFSSYAHVQRLPIDSIKIDRSFVEQLTTGEATASLASSIVAMGQALGLHTVAEGIETGAQLEVLRGLGCQRGQGYLFSRPVSYDEAAALVIPAAQHISA